MEIPVKVSLGGGNVCTLLVRGITMCLFLGCLLAHSVTYNPKPMILTFGGQDGSITIGPEADDPNPECVVFASAKPQTGAGPALVSISPDGPDPASTVVLKVHVLRQPQGSSESVTISGSWAGTGDPGPPCSKAEAGNIAIGVTVNSAVPVVNAVVNGASFAGGGIVPGEIATIFGSNLTASTGINLVSSLPLPTAFLDVSVIINDPPVPLFAVDNVNGQQQINFQVPWELASKSTATVAVANGVTGAAVSVPVLAAQPGVFSYSAGGKTFGAILHANFQLADIAHPVTAGETVLIYCTGLGVVASPPANGGPGNGQPTTVTPTVMIGGISSTVTFSGLAPGFVGLYQVNAMVPSGLSSGNQPVVITMGTSSSNSVLLPLQ